MGGGGGGSSPPARPKGFDDPWVPNARYEFGARPESQDEYYEKGGPYWPRGGVDGNGNFTEGAYSYNPVGEYNRSIMDFVKSGATVQPGGGGIADWVSAIGQRPSAPTPRPELMPGGFPAQHPATTPLQQYGGVQGGFSMAGSGGDSGDPSGGIRRGETRAPDRYIDDYDKAGLVPPGYVSATSLQEQNPGKRAYANGYTGSGYGLGGGPYYTMAPSKLVSVEQADGSTKWTNGSYNKYSKLYDDPNDVPVGY